MTLEASGTMTTGRMPTGGTDAGQAAVTVLFVDDEPDMLDVYTAMVSREYTVETASGAEEALETFGSHIDFAFVDRRMPGMTGDELIQTLRDRGYQTPFAIISAVDPDDESAVDTQAYLRKPIDKDEIQSTITEYYS